MPPVPPSNELSGRPARILMFCSGDVPYSTSTRQWALFTPLAGMSVLVAALMTGLPANPPADRRGQSVAYDSERTRLSEVDDKSAHEVNPDQHAHGPHDQVRPWDRHAAAHHPREGEAE